MVNRLIRLVKDGRDNERRRQIRQCILVAVLHLELKAPNKYRRMTMGTGLKNACLSKNPAPFSVFIFVNLREFLFEAS